MYAKCMFFSSNVLPNILWLLDAVVFLVCCFQHVMCVITRGVLNCFFFEMCFNSIFCALHIGVNFPDP